MPYPRKQSGIALIAALLAVALATTAAVYLTGQNELYKRRTFNLLGSDQAYQYAIGMEAVAMSVLNESFKTGPTEVITNDLQIVSQPLILDIPDIQGGQVMGKLTDLQSLYNLGSLSSGTSTPPVPPPTTPPPIVSRGSTQPTPTTGTRAVLNAPRRQFDGLINQFRDPLNPSLSYIDLVDAIVDWTDRDINTTGISGAEDQYYLGLERPYRAANRRFAHISELRLLKGVTPELYELIKPFITILPSTVNVININTAPAEVLISLVAVNSSASVSPLTPQMASSLVTQSRVKPFLSTDEFIQDPIITSSPSIIIPKDMISVTSSYFLLEAEARINGTSSAISSILYRDKQNGKVQVISRSLKAL